MSNELLASKTILEEEEPVVRPIQGVQTAVFGMVGLAERGPIGVATLCTSPEEFKKTFGGYIAAAFAPQAVDGYYGNGGRVLWFTRTVHFADNTDPSTKTSAAAAKTVQSVGGSPFAASVTGSVVGPYALVSGDTFKVNRDGLGVATATFTAAAASRESTNSEATPFALANGNSLTVKIDGGAVQTIAFLTAEFVDITNATAEEVAAVINAKIVGALATASSSGTKVTITSDRKGTGSHVEVTGGTANSGSKLNFSTAVANGSGNVSNILAVTVAEVKTIVEAAVSGVTVSNASGAVKITSNTTGGSSLVQIDATSTADDELGFDNATHSGGTGAAADTLTFSGKSDGTYANGTSGMSLVVEVATSGAEERFNLRVVKNGVSVERFPNLTMNPNDPRYAETIVNSDTAGSNLVAAADELGTFTSFANARPANGTYTMTGGADGLSSIDDNDFTGASSEAGRTGMRALDLIANLSLLAIPDRATAITHNAMIAYCEVTRSGSVLPILDPPASMTAQAIVEYVETTAAIKELTEFGALYWPRIKVQNPNKTVFGKDLTTITPPSGHIAGICARNDAKEGGVYLAPAGVDQGVIVGCLGFETDECLDEGKRDLVYPANINPLCVSGGVRVVDGSRTLKSTGNFPSVSERRGVIFIEQSVKVGIQFARHKNNDESLRSTCDRTVTKFLVDECAKGAFRYRDPAKAFYVDFGPGLNNAATVFAKKLYGRIGLATQKPNEWTILSFAQDTRDLAATLANTSTTAG